MEPGYKKGSILYVKPVYGKKEYKRNSVVLFINPYNQKKTIGRVIAINGDKISIYKKKVYLNDSVLEEKYTQFTDSRGFIPSEYSKRDFMDPKIIKSGYYFILTDNRDESPDSRDFGSIEGKHIIGKVLF
jgi:signal peptidase I